MEQYLKKSPDYYLMEIGKVVIDKYGGKNCNKERDFQKCIMVQEKAQQFYQDVGKNSFKNLICVKKNDNAEQLMNNCDQEFFDTFTMILEKYHDEFQKLDQA